MTSIILQINTKRACFTSKVFSNVNKNIWASTNMFMVQLSLLSPQFHLQYKLMGFLSSVAFITLHAEIFVHSEVGWIWQAGECNLLQLITLVPAVEIPVKFSKDTCGKIITSRIIKEIIHRTNPSKHGLQGMILRGEEVKWRPHSSPLSSPPPLLYNI